MYANLDPEEIARQKGMPVEEVNEVLNSLREKGLITDHHDGGFILTEKAEEVLAIADSLQSDEEQLARGIIPEHLFTKFKNSVRMEVFKRTWAELVLSVWGLACFVLALLGSTQVDDNLYKFFIGGAAGFAGAYAIKTLWVAVELYRDSMKFAEDRRGK